VSIHTDDKNRKRGRSKSQATRKLSLNTTGGGDLYRAWEDGKWEISKQPQEL